MYYRQTIDHIAIYFYSNIVSKINEEHQYYVRFMGIDTELLLKVFHYYYHLTLRWIFTSGITPLPEPEWHIMGTSPCGHYFPDTGQDIFLQLLTLLLKTISSKNSSIVVLVQFKMTLYSSLNKL
jgi:hypothetical protein